LKRKFAFIALLLASPAVGAATRGGPVEILVEVNEIDEGKAARLGVEWPVRFRFAETNGTTVGVGSIERLTNLQADIHLLIEEGAAESLASPNLVTDSGTQASFHAGGQIPYATTSSLGASNVQFKDYGVIVSILPVVLEDGRIRMKVKASVSAPDSTNAAVVSGTAVPALREREVESNVTLRAGTTMMLAGLAQTQKESVVSGVPVLRRIPLLGALFRWKRTNERRTTIIVFVTPRLVPI
jgi:pilus assembly protein CpaC